jgi:hypothetical protein
VIKITLARRIGIYNGKCNHYNNANILTPSPFIKKDLEIEREQLKLLCYKEYPQFDSDRVLSIPNKKDNIILTPLQIVDEIDLLYKEKQ